MFLAPEGDHYRTRLTHTLEVAQIARTIARALRLNEDLTEAIALGHDLGHTPFGHVGEAALNECLEEVAAAYPETPYPFRHNEQSLRVVDVLEYEGKGLNLTWEVRDGILHHTGDERAGDARGARAWPSPTASPTSTTTSTTRSAAACSPPMRCPPAPVAVLGPHHAARITTMVEDMIAHLGRAGRHPHEPVRPRRDDAAARASSSTTCTSIPRPRVRSRRRAD